MRKLVVSAVFIFTLLIGGAFVWTATKDESTACDEEYRSDVVLQQERVIKLEVADTNESRTKGLSGRLCIPADSGMLFRFDEEGLHGIWMKDMRFPIDIVWLDANKRVVSIKGNVKPETYPEVFLPAQKALYVIELPAGTTGILSIQQGMNLDWK